MNREVDAPVVAEIRRQLLAGIDANQRTRGPRVGGVLTAVAGLLAVLAVVFVARPDEAAAYTISNDDGRIVVKMQPDFDEVSQLEDDLAERGVSLEIATVTAAPDLVGSIEVVSRSGTTDGLEIGTGTFSIDPEHFSGSVEIVVFVKSVGNGPAVHAPSAFYPGQPLGGLPCATGGPVSVSQLRAAAAQAGIADIDWHLSSSRSTDVQSRAEIPVTSPTEGWVAEAQMSSADELRVTIWPVDETAKPPTPLMGDGLHSSIQPSCTSALADRWPDIK